jgi:transcriptional regulator with XRE-family HTH domain
MKQDLDRLTEWRRAIGRRMRVQRALFGITQKQAADRAHIHQTTWSRLERGEASVTDDVAIRIAPAIGVSESFLLFGVDTPVRDGVAA